MRDSFGSRATLRVGGREVRLARLDALEKQGRNISRLPYSLRILLENLLRREDGSFVADVDQPAWWRWYSWPYWWYHFNGIGRFKWNVKVEPGKSLELGYTWHYYWQ